jgi:hypothetical protein
MWCTEVIRADCSSFGLANDRLVFTLFDCGLLGELVSLNLTFSISPNKWSIEIATGGTGTAITEL